MTWRRPWPRSPRTSVERRINTRSRNAHRIRDPILSGRRRTSLQALTRTFLETRAGTKNAAERSAGTEVPPRNPDSVKVPELRR
jgi:hypothetical protein